jgi:hypothetical protein
MDEEGLVERRSEGAIVGVIIVLDYVVRLVLPLQ